MSKTTQTVQKQIQSTPKNVVLQSRKNSTGTPFEDDDEQTNSEFYGGIIENIKNAALQLYEDKYAANVKATALERALTITKQKNTEVVNDLTTQLKLANQELNYYKEKHIDNKASRQNISNIAQDLFKLKDKELKKNFDKDVEEQLKLLLNDN